jgi:hypothetical protein
MQTIKIIKKELKYVERAVKLIEGSLLRNLTEFAWH